jgi:iron complex outermembrane receptor protein
MRKTFIVLLLAGFSAFGQSDTTKVLDEVKVSAFSTGRSVREIAAPIHILGTRELERFENAGFVNALNIYPGVQMEERSPGSYRISIRGSSVRSPFGVRNVKVYWNGIPLTDANGNTYFNLLDMNSIGSIEVLKGPTASMYGAGLGGVLLLENQNGTAVKNQSNKLTLNYLAGSYNTQNRSVSYTHATKKSNNFINYSHAGTDGYRDHSNMRRDVFNWRSSLFLTDKHTLNLMGFYGDLYYQTPGGINQAQMDANPRLARQPTPTVPGSEQQKAAIYQKLLSFGLSHDYRVSSDFSTSIALFGNATRLENPFITNYEYRKQQSFGVRNVNSWSIRPDLKAVFGVEYQQSASDYDVYDNEGGVSTDLQFKERVDAYAGSAFAQLEYSLPAEIVLTAGMSLNSHTYDYAREGGLSLKKQTAVPWMPRFSVLKKIGNSLSFFGSVSSGFSSPTVEEFVSVFLVQGAGAVPVSAESGVNYELGLKGKSGKWNYSLNAYHLKMNNALIRKTSEEGINFFENAGKTTQKGIEFLAGTEFTLGSRDALNILVSGDLKDYTFLKFSDGEVVFDGKKIPSVPAKNFNLILDYVQHFGFFWNNTLNFVDRIQLNNANTVSADAYWLLNSRLGWKKTINSFDLKLYAGVDNALNSSYSLGNDINAFGNRFFNPAPKRNYNGGIQVALRF